jgi:AcrR family transcriptional regulator/ferredoxin
MNSSLILVMGRIAGVTAAETRERLLRAAADAFARRGYDGTRVADIAAAAGVSSGALYAHFGSKAELLVAALRAHGPGLLAEVLAADPGRSATELLLLIGRRLPRRRDARGYLITEALVAARRDEDVARPMRDYVGQRGDWLAELVGVAQADGELDPSLSPNALAHFCLLLAMGSALITPDLHAVGEQEWAALLTRLVTALAPPPSPHRAITAQNDQRTERNSTVKVQINPELCQGHGRCYDLAPGLFRDDEEGYGQVRSDGAVPPEAEHDARLAALNCPEHAVKLLGEE